MQKLQETDLDFREDIKLIKEYLDQIVQEFQTFNNLFKNEVIQHMHSHNNIMKKLLEYMILNRK